MANPEHLELLRQGVDGWNAWRAREPSARPDLSGANLYPANLSRADLFEANLTGANLSKVNLIGANLTAANLVGANLSRANLVEANLTAANLTAANLSGADLSEALLVRTNLENAVLTDCRIYGISAWDVKLSDGTKQQSLIITPDDEPAVTVDDLEVAQFVYLLLVRRS